MEQNIKTKPKQTWKSHEMENLNKYILRLRSMQNRVQIFAETRNSSNREKSSDSM